jgi:hypothetical protein
METPVVITDPAEMRAWARARRAEGKRIGFVPTMVCVFWMFFACVSLFVGVEWGLRGGGVAAEGESGG